MTKPAKSQLTDGRLQDYVNNLKHESIGLQEYGYLERNLMLGDSLDYPAELMKSKFSVCVRFSFAMERMA